MTLSAGRHWLAAPFLVLLAALAIFVQTMFPWALLVVGAGVVFGLVVFRYPLAGFYLWLVLYPLTSCHFSLHAFGFQSFEKNTIPVFVIEIMNVILMLVLVVKQLDQRLAARDGGLASGGVIGRWLLYLAVLFTLMTVGVVLASDNIPCSAVGAWRLVGNFFAVAFMVVYLRRFTQFVRVLVFYCFVAVACALLAIASTNHGFQKKYQLIAASDYQLYGQLALFNRSGQYYPPTSGMVTGVGLSGKHELSLLMMTGTVFVVFLVTRYRAAGTRFMFALMAILFAAIYQQAFSRTSMAGCFVILALTVMMIAPWRKWLPMVMIACLAFNVVGIAGAYQLQPESQKKTASIRSSVVKSSSSSKYDASTLGQRLMIYGQTIDRIAARKGLGSGPDSLMRDFAFGWPHGHNIFLTLAAEYGVPAMMLFATALMLIGSACYSTVFVSPRVGDPVWLLQVTLIVAVLLALFEYQTDLLVYSPHLWLMIGLLLAALRNLPAGAAAAAPGPLRP